MIHYKVLYSNCFLVLVSILDWLFLTVRNWCLQERLEAMICYP